jgi:hypothetical protein
MARTVHTYTVHVPFSYEEKVYTGRTAKEISLFFFGRAQKVFKTTGKNIDNCDIIEKTGYFRTPWGEELPFGYGAVTATEYRLESATRTLATARSMAQAELQACLAADSTGRTVLEKSVEYGVDGDGITLFCTVVCEENIARTQEFTLQP